MDGAHAGSLRVALQPHNHRDQRRYREEQRDNWRRSASANVYSADESAQKSAVIFAVRKRSVSRVNERLASCDPASEPMPPCRLRKR
jgi:molybdopterin-guanine dinucleotide biosynthesis protein